MASTDNIYTAVARATGERMSEVRRHGFSIADPIDVTFDPEPGYLPPPQLIDWDAVERQRNVPFIAQADSAIR